MREAYHDIDIIERRNRKAKFKIAVCMDKVRTVNYVPRT